MPKGEFSPVMNTDFVSATPSPSLSRSRVMRLALGTPAPARFITTSIALPFTPSACTFFEPGSGSGLLLSATSTSPLGSV
jgi:hypothetical protein